jgi:glycine cleavage system aminomethyltransferase T
MILNPRLRPSPYERRAIEHGAKLFTLYNRMTLPLIYDSYEKEYQHLCEHVQIWDVGCERQVEIVGPDALELVELITPRDISSCAVGQCKYAPLCDEHGGIMNDPIILRLAEDRFWLSIADSDINFWVRGIAWGRGYDVRVFEPDVSPLAIQGPKADDLVAEVVGEHTRDIRFFWFIDETLAGAPVRIARSGWSGKGGFEIYLEDGSKGSELWDLFWDAGQKYNLKPGAPNLIERIESGLKSYGQDMSVDTNPFEASLDRYLDLDKTADYMSREALAKVAATGPARRLVNLKIDIDIDAAAPSRAEWRVVDEEGRQIGVVTSRTWSPRFGCGIAYAMLAAPFTAAGTKVVVDVVGDLRRATVQDGTWKQGQPS